MIKFVFDVDFVKMLYMIVEVVEVGEFDDVIVLYFVVIR